jgi:c-di-GMP-binding flagellar brake protein YcgR
MGSDNSEKERRRFPRLTHPVYYRLARSKELRQRVSNISAGGVRIYSDVRFEKNEQIELELFFPDGYSGKGTTRVVWVHSLPPGSGPLYDIGLEFLELPDEAIKRLIAAIKE